MIWKLTDTIWWGNADALADLQGAKSVLAVGGNLENLPLMFTPLNVPEKIPYLRVASPDHEPVTGDYFELLRHVASAMYWKGYKPILVHCRAGQQRSVSTAMLLAVMVGELDWPSAIGKARALRSDIMRFADGSVPPYCRSLLTRAGCPEYLL